MRKSAFRYAPHGAGATSDCVYFKRILRHPGLSDEKNRVFLRALETQQASFGRGLDDERPQDEGVDCWWLACGKWFACEPCLGRRHGNRSQARWMRLPQPRA